MARLKCPYTYPHKTRAQKAQYICSIGGYSAGRGENYPIEFCVSTHQADLDFETVWGKYATEHIPDTAKVDPEAAGRYYQLARRLHKENASHLWEWGQEGAVRSLEDSDAYRMLWSGKLLDVELSLQGRGGKHLVIAAFEKNTLKGMSDTDLQDSLMAQEDSSGNIRWDKDTLLRGHTWAEWTSEEVDTLYKYVRQCEVDFTVEKASAEVEYQGAWQFFVNSVEPAWETECTEEGTRSKCAEAAQSIYDYLRSTGSASAVYAELVLLAETCGVVVDDVNFS